MSLHMSVPQGIPALQQENLALRKQLRRAEEDHRDALEQAARDSQKALKRAEEDRRGALEQAAKDSQKALGRVEEDHRDAPEQAETSHQQALFRAHQDRHDAQDSLFQALETNRSLVQQLEDLRKQSQATAQESLELQKQLQELKKQHQVVVQESLQLRQKLDKLWEQYRSEQRILAENMRQVADEVTVQTDFCEQLFRLALPVSDTADKPMSGDEELCEMRRRLQEIRDLEIPPSKLRELQSLIYNERCPSERSGRFDSGSDGRCGARSLGSSRRAQI